MPSDFWCSSSRYTVGGVKVRCKLVLVLVLLAILPNVYTESYGPSPDFSKHTLVKPRIYHGRTRRQISTTKENELDHADLLTVGFELDGVKRILDLRLNSDLIPVGYRQSHQHRGAYVVQTPSKVELCHYQGSVRDVPGSWVAVSTCKGLRGVVFDGENLHHIHPEGESLDSDHYVYKQNDLVANHTCGYEGTPHRVQEHHGFVNRATRHKRAAEVIRGPYNANRGSRYVELVLVIDNKEYVALDQNLERVHQHCKDIANIINALYMPLNIFIALVGVQVWTDTDEIVLSPNGDTTLSNFLRYRREKLYQDMPNDNAQLLTRIVFDGGVVGKALKGPICTYEFSGGVSMDHSTVVGLVAATVAHEMGHNFGMEHDSADCECPEEKCIMSSSSGSSGPTHWSTCSLEHLALAFNHGMDYCLRNKPQKLFDSPICGNGFVEPGEQCDCGLKENCDNPCCNVTTCMLHSNASCATGECCDLKTCRPKTAGTMCRKNELECDLPEYCTGQSEYCPVDVFKMDGEPCDEGRAFCYQGSCRTHNDQCKLLWGPSGTSSDSQCYEMNNKGTKHGNCGYNRIDTSYRKCSDEDLLCGMLHCKHLNERLEFGMESVATLSHSFINNGGKIIPCRSVTVDLGLNQIDPGLAPDGAKCAPGKMCVNQKCMPVADLRASVSDENACPNNCGGKNGVCNSLGHCHCWRGFRPPDCTQPGVGGSEDSGPAEDPNARNDFIMALYIIFLGIVPTVALSWFGVWHMRNSCQHWKKGMVSTTDRGLNRLSIKTIDRSSPLPRTIETIDSSLSQDPACASLLPKADNDECYNNNLFGQFKGFTITPIKSRLKSPEPTKPAPPPPTIPTVVIKTNIKPIPKSTCGSLLNSTSSFTEASTAPTLPPPNPGFVARPLISSPVLAATTCTSVELVAPKISANKPIIGGPTRPAPAPPISDKPQRPNSTPLTNVLVPPEPEKKQEKNSTLNRIASMLRPNSGIIKGSLQISDKNTNSLPRMHHLKANKVIDKEILRNLEISNPIPQKEIEIPTQTIPVIPPADTQEKKNVVLRAQSMRDSKITPRPTIHTFGSMRQTTPVKRPTSIPASTRPTAPPPGPPISATGKINETGKIPGLPGYQNPQVKSAQKVVENTYDDCMNLVSDQSLTKITEESPTSDNIYAVIEEALPEKNKKNAQPEKQLDNEYKSPKCVDTTVNAGGLDSMGLLSEIVSEISNRNFDSIYSTATLSRKSQDNVDEAKNAEYLDSNSSLGTYMNSNHYKSPGSIYSNSVSGKFNSSSSTTSSGYLNPSALNMPQQAESENKQLNKNKLSSLNSINPNINDEISKELGMKPTEEITNRKPVAPLKTRPVIASSKSEEKMGESKEPSKSTLRRTKTPPKNSLTKDSNDARAATKQALDNALRTKQYSDNSLKGSKQGSNGQNSDTKSGTNASQANGSSDKQDSHTNVNRLSLKTVPCSPKDNGGKFNSPDVVSSCSNSNQISTKSPDVVGKVNFQPKTRSSGIAKSPTTPTKPLSIASKGIGLAEKKKSPTGNPNKSLSVSAKETTLKSSQSKPGQKLDTKSGETGTKTNSVQRAANSKSNVAFLQQKFEANKTINAPRTIPNVHKKIVGKTNEATGIKK